MALQPQEVELSFGQGLDKKTDPKAVVQGKMLLLENAVFTEGHRISKRWGYGAIDRITYSPYNGTSGTLVAPKMIKAYNDEIVCADSGRLYSLAPNFDAWIDKGPYESLESSQQEISAGGPNTSQTFQSCTLLNNYMLATWQQADTSTSNTSAVAAIFDITTNTKIFPDTLYATQSGNARPKCCVLGGAVLALFYVTGANVLSCTVFTITGQVVSYATSTVFTGIGSNDAYDVAGTATGGVVNWNGNTKTIDTTGAVTHSASGFTGVGSPSITVGTNGNIWIYGVKAANELRYIIYSSTLGAVLADTSILTTTGSDTVTAGVAVADSTTQQCVVISKTNQTTFTPYLPTVTKLVSSLGVITSTSFASASMNLFSKPFYSNGHRYIFMLYAEQGTAPYPSQPQIILMNMDTQQSTAFRGSGVAAAKGFVGTAPALPYRAAGGFYSNVISFSSTKFAVASSYLTTILIEGTVKALVNSSALMVVDWDSQDAYQGLVFNNQLILNGGITSMYDGNTVAELGFTFFPSIDSAGFNGNAGNIPIDGNYLYTAVYQWTDNQGNLHQSAPGLAVVPTDAAGSPATQECNIIISAPALTTKDPLVNKTITVAVYRTPTNGTLFYLCGYTAVSPDPTSTTTIIFTDNLTDADLVLGTPLYTNGGVLANDPPPPSMISNSHNNRAWLLDSTDPNTNWYSKTSEQTVGASFSGDLIVTVDSKGGPINGQCELDDKQILFKENDRIVILYGDGANDTGTGATFAAPQFVQTDVGCSASKSILSQPNGVMFKSPKGWYLLDRSTQVHYIGSPVETYNSQDVTSALRLKDKTLCVFLTTSGSTLAYDYFFNQWSTFTNHLGVSADIFQNAYTYARTDGLIYQQIDGRYLDSSTTFLLRAQTSWLRMDKIQGFQRIRQVFALGDHLSPATGHGIQISTAYDFESTFGTPVAYTFTGTGDQFQYREHLARQKCDTVSLLIEEVASGAGVIGEFLDLTDLGFEAAIKKGPNKLPASQSVG